MGIQSNGNQFDYQRVLGTNTPVSGVDVYTSRTLDVVNGLNVGAPAVSGVTINFTVPNALSYETRTFTVVHDGAYAGGGQVVLVSGVGCTINGSTDAVTIAGLVGKTFYNSTVGYNQTVSGVTSVVTSGNWISF